MLKKTAIIVFLICFVPLQTAFPDSSSIGYLFKGNFPTKVYVKDVINESDQDTGLAQQLKKGLESALSARKTTKFELVKNPAESEIQIAASIKTCKDPKKVMVEYKVIYTKTEGTLWSGTLVDNPDKISLAFIKRCFGKANDKEKRGLLF